MSMSETHKSAFLMWTLCILPKLVRDDENDLLVVSVRAPTALFGVNPVLACVSVTVLMTKTIYVFLTGAVGTCLGKNAHTPRLSYLCR
jgi:hypothetical protein